MDAVSPFVVVYCVGKVVSHAATGYPKAFAQKAGLIECKLGGSEGDVEVGSDPDHSGEEEEKDEDAADLPPKVTPKRSALKNPRSSAAKSKLPTGASASTHSVAFELDDIRAELEFIDEDSGMRLVTAVKENVTVVGFAPVRHHDIVVLQATLPPGGILESIRVEIDREDPNCGTISLDEDANLLSGSRNVKKDWKKGNMKLAEELDAILDLAWKGKYGVDGTTPLRGKLTADFKWPEGLKSQLNPLDPYVLGFRERPSTFNQTLFEVKSIQVSSRSGRVVPASRLTAFFLVEKHTHINNSAGRDLKVGDASDTESEGETPSPRKRHRGRQSGGADSAGGDDATGPDVVMN